MSSSDNMHNQVTPVQLFCKWWPFGNSIWQDESDRKGWHEYVLSDEKNITALQPSLAVCLFMSVN